MVPKAWSNQNRLSSHTWRLRNATCQASLCEMTVLACSASMVRLSQAFCALSSQLVDAGESGM